MASKRISITLAPLRSQFLGFRAQELGIPVARLAAEAVDRAIDQLASDAAFVRRWEAQARREAEAKKLKAWEGRE